MHVLLSIATILLIYALTRQWVGPVAARWAAALLAFNEYYLAVSSRATAHVPYLFFVAAALLVFSRFLSTQRPAFLYAAAAALGLAFYCKEHAVLLLPFFFIALLRSGGWKPLRSPHPYLAALVFAAIVGPDIYWNLTTNRETARATACVPMTSVSKNGLSSSIERATCDSAAKWTTRSDSATRLETSSESLTSPLTSLNLVDDWTSSEMLSGEAA